MTYLSRTSAAGLAFAILALTDPAGAWVYPEHREIALQSVESLDPQRRRVFDALWRDARPGSERFCVEGVDLEQSTTPGCIDWAALSGIAGDHSCSPMDMSEIVLTSDWILDVADVSAQLKKDLATIEVGATAEQAETGGFVADLRRRQESEAVRAERINALRTADNRLQRADPEYATRAGSNNAHFLLARPSTDTDTAAYAALVIDPGAEISAMGVYSWFHLRALEKAWIVAHRTLSPERRELYIRGMFLDEAFALHFLEDMYAAGHVAGSWGDASQRKGTHDYYNEAGLEAFSWGRDGTGVVLMGDAHMRPRDAALAARGVRRSLEQVLDVASGREGAPDFVITADIPPEPDAFDVCENDRMPTTGEGRLVGYDVAADLREILIPTAVPGLAPGLGAMPRFRAEVGPFLGFASAIDGRSLSGGFLPGQGGGVMGGLDIAASVGLGLDGVIGESGDGLVFAQVGFRADTPSSQSLAEGELVEQGGSITAAIPARRGLSARFRMPFYLVPFDLLFLSPLYLASPETYTQMAVTAGNGGLIPWQQGLATRFGRFQFVLGREFGLNFYGAFSGSDRLIAPRPESEGGPILVSFDSLGLQIPLVEYRPYRAFSENQSSQLLFQFFAGLDIPSGGRPVIATSEPDVDLDVVWSLGLRFGFDWRYYF